PLDKLTVSQKRIFGYLAERMMNIWLLKNNLRLKELPIMENLNQPNQLEQSRGNDDETQISVVDLGSGSDRASVS
ncbi:MAG: hypothetical protein IJU71_02145, partial [Selenomonadaceae bacterium]|nr:hypothetical protein [Selenomonadaceae bacterium]